MFVTFTPRELSVAKSPMTLAEAKRRALACSFYSSHVETVRGAGPKAERLNRLAGEIARAWTATGIAYAEIEGYNFAGAEKHRVANAVRLAKQALKLQEQWGDLYEEVYGF